MTIPHSKLATPWQRLAAQLIDSCLQALPTILIVPIFLRMFGLIIELEGMGLTEEEVSVRMNEAIFTSTTATLFVLMAIGWIALLIVQCVLLTKSGQTMGKKLMQIRVVMQATGKNGGFVPNVLLRSFVNWLISCVPFVGGIYGMIDALFIFREDRLCIHDHMAKTIVVKA